MTTTATTTMVFMTDARTGLCVCVSVDTADGRSERRNALMMPDRVRARHRLVPKKFAADAGYASGEYLCEVEFRGITPHSAMPRMKVVKILRNCKLCPKIHFGALEGLKKIAADHSILL